FVSHFSFTRFGEGRQEKSTHGMQAAHFDRGFENTRPSRLAPRARFRPPLWVHPWLLRARRAKLFELCDQRRIARGAGAIFHRETHALNAITVVKFQ